MRIFFIWFYGWGRNTHKPKRRNETSSARLLQTQCTEYKFPFAGICLLPSVFIMRVNLPLECSYWSCIKSHCYVPIQQWARWGGKMTGDQMSWWQHAELSKVPLSIKIDAEREWERARERGEISAGAQPSDISEKPSFPFCHPPLLLTKSTDASDEAIWATAFASSRRTRLSGFR